MGEFTSGESLSLFRSASNGHQIERMETLKGQNLSNQVESVGGVQPLRPAGLSGVFHI